MKRFLLRPLWAAIGLVLLLLVGCEMPLPKQPVTFGFGAVEQSTGRRWLDPGALVEATNLRLSKDGELSKRPGFDRAAPEETSGSFTTGAESLTSDGHALVSRDGANRAWLEDLTGNARTSLGEAPRALPTDFGSGPLPRARKPILLSKTGGGFLMLVMGDTATGVPGYYIWALDAALARSSPVQFVSAPGIETWGATVDGSEVWVLWSAGDTAYSHHMPDTIAAPIETAYYQEMGGGGVITGVDIGPAGSHIAVVITSTIHSGGLSYTRATASYLDTATAIPVVSPAATAIEESIPLPDTYDIGAPSIHVGGTNAAWYFAYYKWDGARVVLVRVSVVTATLTLADAELDSDPSAAGPEYGIAVGFQAASMPTTFAAHDNLGDGDGAFVLKGYDAAGAATELRRQSYPVSKPFLIGSTWYLLTGSEDSGALQNTYWLTRADGVILSPALSGLAAGFGLDGTDSAAPYLRWFATSPVVVGSTVLAGVPKDVGGGGADDGRFTAAVLKFDLAAEYGPPVRYLDGMIAFPGGAPVSAGAGDAVASLAPMLAPPPLDTYVGSGAPLAGTTVLQARYRFTDSRGRFTRSAPTRAVTLTFTDGSDYLVDVKPLTHYVGAPSVQVELYASVVGGVIPYLVAVMPNDPTADRVRFSATQWDPSNVPTSEALDTLGGGLVPLAPPAFRAVGFWGERLTGSAGSVLYYTDEIDDGAGPKFSGVLRVLWNSGSGDILGHAPIDANSYAMFKADAVGYINGAGPDGRGIGNFKAWTLNGKHGLRSMRSVVSAGAGVFWQDIDGRIRCLTPGLAIVDAFAGMEDYREETVSAAVHVEPLGQVWFATESRLLVLDYAHPTASQPLGRWFSWTSAGLLQAFGAAVLDGAPHLLEAGGTLRTPGTTWADATATISAPVLYAAETGDLAAAGKLAGFLLSAVAFEGQYRGDSTIRMTVNQDHGATVSYHPATFTEGPVEIWAEPPGCDEIGAVSIRIEETAASTEGAALDAISLVIQPRGRTKFPTGAARH